MLEDVPVSVPAPSTAFPPPIFDPKGYRVFHVNDSTDDQVLFQAACRKAGVPFNWHVADSAEKGISYLRTLVEHSRTLPVSWPDLVLLDVVMPFVSGFEVLRFIRGTPELKHLPVIIFTGSHYPKTRQEALNSGADGFLLKPHDFNEVVALAKQLYEMLRTMKGQAGLASQEDERPRRNP